MPNKYPFMTLLPSGAPYICYLKNNKYFMTIIMSSSFETNSFHEKYRLIPNKSKNPHLKKIMIYLQNLLYMNLRLHHRYYFQLLIHLIRLNLKDYIIILIKHHWTYQIIWIKNLTVLTMNVLLKLIA